jgi:hypothetical protein
MPAILFSQENGPMLTGCNGRQLPELRKLSEKIRSSTEIMSLRSNMRGEVRTYVAHNLGEDGTAIRMRAGSRDDMMHRAASGPAQAPFDGAILRLPCVNRDPGEQAAGPVTFAMALKATAGRQNVARLECAISSRR